MINICVNKADIVFGRKELLTAGMYQAVTCHFEFCPEWDGLTKSAVFSCGTVNRDVFLNSDDECYIPQECLSQQNIGQILKIGVYGINGLGEIIIPTIYGKAGIIYAGADPEGDPSLPPTPTVTEQILADNAYTRETVNTLTTRAENAAESAEESASAAGTSAESAENSANAAASSASGAAGSASAAASSAESAEESASAAGTSAESAENSASAAESSATSAAGSASAAASSAESAASSASAAASSAESTAGSASAAEESAESAAGSASAAEESAESAAGYASAAASSAEKAEDAITKYPYIDPTTGNWFVYDAENEAWVDTLVHAKGETGNGIESIELLSTSGKNKTYRITFTDGTHFDYVVKDGEDGSSDAGDVTYDPEETYEDGTVGKELQEIGGDLSQQSSAIANKIDKNAQAEITAAMTEPVGIDADGKLWSKPGSGGGTDLGLSVIDGELNITFEEDVT